ncbi:hypothetical protein ACIBH1_07800 [Nonomuraea sp. NPDC050663]|uniref:hypothetical protein n=1 Tax=Nonomuraea sp. NPDC050663 TaxID=3364370 RepID=UPI0037943D07
MANILRALLTAAVLAAIVVRLRRRGRRTKAEPLPSPAPVPAERRVRLWVPAAVVAAALVVTLSVVFTPSASRGEQQAAPALPWQVGATAAATPIPTPTATPALTPQAVVACPAPREAVTVRPISPRVRQAVARQWRRIERWTAANAPRTFDGLGRQGRARTVAVAEARMGIGLPDDLRASLLRHDGGLPLPPGFGPAYGARQILGAWREACAGQGGVLVTRQSTGQADGATLRRTIPVAPFAWLDPATGAVGYSHPASSSSFPRPLGASWLHTLRSVAVALERGSPLAGVEPRVVAGRLRWEPSS